MIPAFHEFSETIPWGVSRIGADSIHSRFGLRGAGIKIAVLDEGVQWSHPDLGTIVACYDAFGAGGSCVWSYDDHGTAVMGVIAASSNGSGIVGVAPEASTYSARVCDSTCPEAYVYDGLAWAAGLGVDVVNISIGSCGGDVSSQMQALINAYTQAGGFVVAGGGNGSHSTYSCTGVGPVARYAAADNTIGVGAHGTDLIYKAGYQYGPEIDFSAPTDVESTRRIGGVYVYAEFGGTSAASPHVAGAIALMLDAGFPRNKVIPRLIETAFQLGASPHNYLYGYGQIRLDEAIIAKPAVTSISWCTSAGITVPGDCLISASVVNGIGSKQVRFEVSRSDQGGVTVYDWGSSTRTITVAPGDYALSIKAIPREQTYLRVGYHTIQDIPVCTGSGGALVTAEGGESTNATVSCGGGGGEEQ